jgi:hypothetical protein
MNQTNLVAWFLLVSVTTPLVAEEKRRDEPIRLPPRESVKWTPKRNITDAIKKEIDHFAKTMKARLGPKKLAFKPYIAIDDSPAAAKLASVTVEEVVNNMIKLLKERANHDNEDFLPRFQAYRRTPIARGSDLVTEPLFLKHPSIGQLSGNITLKLEWELVEGGFKNNWDNNDIDEVYEAELNGTLTLGIAISTSNDQKLMVIDHAVTTPIVTGWRIELVASEGKAEKTLPAK